MRWVKRTLELKPEQSVVILLWEQIKCLRSPVLLLAVCGLFILLLQCCSSNISSSAPRHVGLDTNTAGSVGGPEHVSASPVSLAARFSVDFDLKEDHVMWLYFFCSEAVCKQRYESGQRTRGLFSKPRQAALLWGFLNLIQCLPDNLALMEFTRVHSTI